MEELKTLGTVITILHDVGQKTWNERQTSFQKRKQSAQKEPKGNYSSEKYKWNIKFSANLNSRRKKEWGVSECVYWSVEIV